MRPYLVTLLLPAVLAVQLRLRYEPRPDDPRSSLIWFNQTSFSEMTLKLDNYFEEYRTPELTPGRREALTECSYGRAHHDQAVCAVVENHFSPCVSSNFFGYRRLQPCVFLHLDRVREWRPQFYNLSALPSDLPARLASSLELIKLNKPHMEKTVWVECDGETAADQELIGSVEYRPSQGFPGYLFPYVGQQGYLDPVLAVHFRNPAVGVVISVACKVYSPGVEHDSKRGFGLTTFQLLVDSKY